MSITSPDRSEQWMEQLVVFFATRRGAGGPALKSSGLTVCAVGNISSL